MIEVRGQRVAREHVERSFQCTLEHRLRFATLDVGLEFR